MNSKLVFATRRGRGGGDPRPVKIHVNKIKGWVGGIFICSDVNINTCVKNNFAKTFLLIYLSVDIRVWRFRFYFFALQSKKKRTEICFACSFQSICFHFFRNYSLLSYTIFRFVSFLHI